MLLEDRWASSCCVTVPARNWAPRNGRPWTDGGCPVSSPFPGAHHSHAAVTCDLVVMLGSFVCLGPMPGCASV